jgi:hypothetical protein
MEGFAFIKGRLFKVQLKTGLHSGGGNLFIDKGASLRSGTKEESMREIAMYSPNSAEMAMYISIGQDSDDVVYQRGSKSRLGEFSPRHG